MKVCHITSAHDSCDTRIFIKECSSLAGAGHETYLIARGESREENGVNVIGLGDPPAGRLKRMTAFAKEVYKEALELDADLYHLHDPELLPWGVRLKRHGKKVIFDSHEDVPAQIMDKVWIPKQLRKMISTVYGRYETRIVKRLDAVVAATPYIGAKFAETAQNVSVVKNLPIFDGIKEPIEYNLRKFELGYTGIRCSEDRGAREMVEASVKSRVKLDIYGEVEPELLSELKQLDPEGIVKFHGLAPFRELQESMSNMKIGFLVEHPTLNAMNALCIKMFEYMSHGIVIISSNIPLWQEIIEDADCGFCVDPFDVDSIVETIKYVLDNPAIGEEKGMNGYHAFLDRYNWRGEAKKLIDLYAMLEKRK